MKCIMSIGCIVFLGLFSPQTTQAQQNQMVNDIGMQFVLVAPGKLTVGKFEPTVSRAWGYDANRKSEMKLPFSEHEYVQAEKAAKAAYRPGFDVFIKQPIFMGKFEVTQGQWKKIMGYNPSFFQGDLISGNADDHPIENISWEDAKSFLRKLNLIDTQYSYRLPTEFEWEYAARAGAQEDISWSDINKTAVIGVNTTKPIGSKQPNAWGLYDMLGNVWEWVEDYYNEKIFADPIPAKSGKQHVLKGAPFYGDVKNATYMTHAGGPGSKYDVGFRVVATPKEKNNNDFVSIFNGKNLDGWHLSRTSHQGTTPDMHVEDGAIVVGVSPFGQGGLLLSDKNYHSFELSLEVKLDSFCNSGIFIRSNEGGAAYQIELSMPGKTGALYGERISPGKIEVPKELQKVWHQGGWNSFRIRMVGKVPRITLWINDILIWDVQQPKNDFIANASDGMIGLQCHWTSVYSSTASAGMPLDSWRPNAKVRFRKLMIKEL